MMEESLFYATQELKRAEHLMYVSLKYTRTGDVIDSLISRLIACFDYLLEALLKKKIEEREIEDVPEAPIARVNSIIKLYPDEKKLRNYMEFYKIIRRISRADTKSEHEFRRNLVAKYELDGKTVEITIDIVSDYYHKTREFVELVRDEHMLDRNK